MLSLSLGVRRVPDAKSAQKSVLSASPEKRKAQLEAALRGDDYVCQCCGFRSKHYQQVSEIDGVLTTLCTFCDSCLSLESAGLGGSGVLIWLPEIKQEALNHLARAIYIAEAEGGELALLAKRARDALLARRTDAKRRLGSDDPMLLATVFLENLSDADYALRAQKVEGVRLLPLDKRIVATRSGEVDMFPKMRDYWRSAEGPFAKKPASTWSALFSDAIKASA